MLDIGVKWGAGGTIALDQTSIALRLTFEDGYEGFEDCGDQDSPEVVRLE